MRLPDGGAFSHAGGHCTPRARSHHPSNPLLQSYGGGGAARLITTCRWVGDTPQIVYKYRRLAARIIYEEWHAAALSPLDIELRPFSISLLSNISFRHARRSLRGRLFDSSGKLIFTTHFNFLLCQLNELQI